MPIDFSLEKNQNISKRKTVCTGSLQFLGKSYCNKKLYYNEVLKQELMETSHVKQAGTKEIENSLENSEEYMSSQLFIEKMETSNITFVRGRLQRRKDGTIKYVSASYQKHLNGTEIHPNMTTILHTRSDSKFVETEKSLKYEKERIGPGKFRFDFFLRSEPTIRTSGRNGHTNDFFLVFPLIQILFQVQH